MPRKSFAEKPGEFMAASGSDIFRQHQPVAAGMIHEPSTRLHQPSLQSWSGAGSQSSRQTYTARDEPGPILALEREFQTELHSSWITECMDLSEVRAL
jgi:hypothetical protein